MCLPFPAAAAKMMQEVPDDTAAMRRLYGLGSTDGAASSLQEGLEPSELQRAHDEEAAKSAASSPRAPPLKLRCGL